MALGLHPLNLPTTLGKIHAISDHIWFIAGDKSVDYNWYTKRAILSSVIMSTELYMLTDGSKNKQDTWDFLDRRLEDVISSGSSIQYFKNLGSALLIGGEAIATILKPEPDLDHKEKAMLNLQKKVREEERAKKED